MIGLLASCRQQSLLGLRIPSNGGLALIQRLSTHLASMIHSHQSRSMSAFVIVQLNFVYSNRRVLALRGPHAIQGAQSAIHLGDHLVKE
jgi:hypothetical protein